MPTFAYKATDASGKVLEGVLEGRDEAAIIERLQAQQLFPLKIAAASGRTKGKRDFSLRKAMARVRRRDVLLLTQQFATLMEAGLDLDRSLAILSDLHQEHKIQEIVDRIRRNVQGGASLADALAKHPKAFSRLYVNMVRSGESGGVLDAILIRLSGFLESSQELRDEVVSAMIYPIILMLMAGGLVTALLTFVIPKFSQIFVELGAELPASTQVVIGIANFIQGYWYFILGGLILLAYGFRSYIATDEGRLRWDGLKLKMPLLGPLFQKIEVARFTRTMGTLIRSGVPLLSALSIVKDTLTNQVIGRALISVYGGIKEGSPIWEPLKATGVFPAMSIHMIRVGEETGALEAMLLKVADTYETDVRTTTKRVVGLLEPIIILVMGLVVGSIVISMLLAIFSVSDLVG